MFNFFKRKGGKADTPEPTRKNPTSVEPPTDRSDVTNEKTGTLRKDVVNLLLPQTDYNQKTGVGALLDIMAGKRRRNKRKNHSTKITPTPAKNTQEPHAPSEADFVKALVLQKYAKAEPKQQHVSLVYVNEPDLDEKRHAEALLREIARSIDCTIDEINEQQMGSTDSKTEPEYETIKDKAIVSYKNDLKGELEKLLTPEKDRDSLGSPSLIKKSNLKPPRSDDGCSDDDRSDNGKKKVTFRKHIIFDDGEQQTDESSFESLTSEEEESEYLEDAIAGDLEYEDNKTIIKVTSDDDSLKRIASDNSDSGFIEISGQEKRASGSESETEEEIIEEIEEEVSEPEIVDAEEECNDTKNLVSQETKFQSQVSALTELADTRCGEADRAREVIAEFRKDIEARDQEIEQLKCDLAAAYKESELVRQRSRSLEEELAAARSCSADLADQLHRRNDESLRQLRAELEDVLARCAELESRVQSLERDKARLEQEKLIQEQKAQEALTAAEANTTKWRTAHESARSQAAARAERMLADCEWKMRELEKRAREAEKDKRELTEEVTKLKAAPPPSHLAELQQLRGLASEQQRSVQSLSLQLQRVETREEALKLEVHRLKELLEKEARNMKEKEEMHLQAIARLEQQHSSNIDALKAEHSATIVANAQARAAFERAQADRTRTALANLRAEHEKDAKNAERKLREVTTRFENLKEVLASKETQFEHSIAEAHSKADWDIMQLRHLLDKADIKYANNIDMMNERFEKEKERLTTEWSVKVQEIEEQASTAAEEARKLLETTRLKLIAEKNDQVNKLKEKHRLEMEDQWEQFMTDKENCLTRMKAECRQEGEEERVKREKELLEEIAELKSQMQSSSCDYDNLAVRAAACGRTLAVTEQELREALERERLMREKRSEDATRLKQVERASKDQIDHLTRKCACLRKLFDDMRARLTARERAAEQESRAKDKELHQLRAEVARLTKILVEQSSPKLGARTRADGCETALKADESLFSKNSQIAVEPNAPRRKGELI